MSTVSIVIPKEINNCGFTQSPVENAIVTICRHFFERDNFLAYVERGGRNCINCRAKIEWYAEIPDLKDSLGKTVELTTVKFEGEHRVERHEERITLEEGIVKALFLIEYAATDTSLDEIAPFVDAWKEKDSENTQTFLARIRKEAVSKSCIAALKKQPAILKRLHASFADISKYGTIQEFVNVLFEQDINFFLFNSLLIEANIQLYSECAREVMGGKEVARESNGEQIIEDAEWGKKMRAMVGILFVMAITIGIGRKIFRLA